MKRPKVTAKRLRELGGRALNSLPLQPVESIADVPPPPDLEPAVCHYAGREFEYLEHLIDVHDGADISPDGWHAILNSLEGCFRQGFYLALLRYADDLKAVPEAAAILKAMEAGRKKGGKVARKKATSKRMDVRRRYRELRKQGYRPKQAREVIHQDTGFSIRQIERDTAGLS